MPELEQEDSFAEGEAFAEGVVPVEPEVVADAVGG